jgi:mono/diheme cytochrome c family protein
MMMMKHFLHRALITTLVPLLSSVLLPASSHASEAGTLIEQGRYLAIASDCIACHTAPHGGKPMAGGNAIASPVGDIVASNITPSKQYGIGNYTEQQFADALRKGIRADGSNLYPAMPYTAYAVLSDQDVHALYAYFMQGVAAVDQPAAETSLPFPMNIRLSMKFWNMLFLNDKPLAPAPERSEQWLRGRYLAEGAAHCSTCHTPRGFLMQERLDLQLSGAQVGPWYAPNITPHKLSGIGSWSQDDLVAYLKTGRLEGKAQAAGSMAEAISNSFRHLNDDDLHAIAVYIMDRPAVGEGAALTRFEQGQAANVLAGFRGVKADAGSTAAMSDEVRGGRIFSANCASCHGYNGQGTKDAYYPSLFHNSASAGINPNNLLATILYGVERESEAGHVFMPPFGKQANALNSLSDDEIASLANYVLKNYGNAAQRVSPADVAVIRNGGPGSPLLLLARIGMALGAVVVLVLLGLWWRRRRRQRTSA